MKKTRTLRLGNKLIIVNGRDPLQYVDLSTNKVKTYKEYEVLVDTAIENWHNGKVRLQKKVFRPDNLTNINILKIPISANGKSYITIKLREVE